MNNLPSKPAHIARLPAIRCTLSLPARDQTPYALGTAATITALRSRLAAAGAAESERELGMIPAEAAVFAGRGRGERGFEWVDHIKQ